MKSVKCFIASAFGFPEVDKIYDKSIVTVLRALKIKSIRVDRINHNNKIDAKIIELINDCSFGIADLTFARPSVYYEAGMIEGLGKQVIYLARSDHFKQKETDTKGFERIHFDLITKNIIPWTESNNVFQRKLKSRIELVLKTLPAEPRLNELDLISQSRFLKLSVKERIETGEELLINYVKKLRLTPIKLRYVRNVFGNNKFRVSLECGRNITQKDLSIFGRQSTEISENYSIKTFKIFLLLDKMPKRKIENALSYFKPLGSNTYQYKNVKFIFIDNIDSVRKIETDLESLKLE